MENFRLMLNSTERILNSNRSKEDFQTMFLFCIEGVLLVSTEYQYCIVWYCTCISIQWMHSSIVSCHISDDSGNMWSSRKHFLHCDFLRYYKTMNGCREFSLLLTGHQIFHFSSHLFFKSQL